MSYLSQDSYPASLSMRTIQMRDCKCYYCIFAPWEIKETNIRRTLWLVPIASHTCNNSNKIVLHRFSFAQFYTRSQIQMLLLLFRGIFTIITLDMTSKSLDTTMTLTSISIHSIDMHRLICAQFTSKNPIAFHLLRIPHKYFCAHFWIVFHLLFRIYTFTHTFGLPSTYYSAYILLRTLLDCPPLTIPHIRYTFAHTFGLPSTYYSA